MGFSLLHAGLAAGAVLAVIPIILHLILRQKPRHELFPALRLIRQRHRVNLRKLRIRHWLLLAMRMLLVALMALALARPSIHGASFIPDQQAPVAAALVFDTSLSMEYREQDQTRLEAAQAIAQELLKEFPDGSEVLVLDTAEPVARFFPELSLVRQRIDSLRLRPRAGSVNQAIIEACRTLNESDRTQKDIYIFTDLAATSFSLDGSAELQAALASVQGGAAVYLLNVAAEKPRNAAIVELAASAQVLPANSDTLVRAVVQDSGQGEEVLLELLLDGQTRGTEQLALEKGKSAQVEFPLPRLKSGVYQGKLVLRNGGGLSFDDERFLALEVRPATRVLLVADLESDSELLGSALAPDLLVQQQRARHRCDRIQSTRLGDKRLSDYDVVCLVNVAELPAARWSDLLAYSMSGGGLAVFAGSRLIADNYNQDIAQDLLPVKFAKPVALDPVVGMQAVVPNHPAIRKIHEWDASALGQVVVERYIETELSDKNSRRVVQFTNGAIALAERTTGGQRPGQVVVVTTSVSSSPREKIWNDLPQFGALFVPLVDGLVNHLAGHAAQQLNYQVGEDVVLQLEREQKLGPYLLHTPDAVEPTRRVPDLGGSSERGAGEGGIVVVAPEALGNYRVTAGEGDQAFEKVFSVNPNPAECRLESFSAAELAALMGEGKYAVARTIDELREVMGSVRIGRELFPWLMPLLLALFAFEHVLANRFYARSDGAGAAAHAPRGASAESAAHAVESSNGPRERGRVVGAGRSG